MAQNVAGYLKSARGQGKRMVVLTGGWHVQYGYGVPKKVVRRLPLPYVVVMPTEIDVPAEKGMNVDMPPVPLRPEDFVWWVRYETLPASPVHLGVRIDDTSGAAVVQEVTKGLPAERSGIRVGDEIVAVAGHPVTNLTGVAYWVDKQEKGSSATVSIRRGGRRSACAWSSSVPSQWFAP